MIKKSFASLLCCFILFVVVLQAQPSSQPASAALHLLPGTEKIDDTTVVARSSRHVPNDGHNEYYAASDFHSTKKYDNHIHIESDNKILLEQAKKDNFRLLNINGDWGPVNVDEQERYALKAIKEYPDLVAYASSFDVKNWNDTEWTKQTLQRLEKSFSNGAVGVKVWKNIGMELKDAQGKFIMIDHPRFDTILDFIEKNNITLLSHQGEPRNCWLPLDQMTVQGDRNYFSEHPQYHMYLHPEYPSYEDQINARDRMLEKHPNLRIVSVHLASLEWDVNEIAKRLDRFPNLAVDIAARIEHLQNTATTDWQKIHDFFIKYQDRIIYGTDFLESENSTQAMAKEVHDKWINDWKFFVTNEALTNSDKMKYKGLKLPKSVVDKIYAKNIEKWIPAVKKP